MFVYALCLPIIQFVLVDECNLFCLCSLHWLMNVVCISSLFPYIHTLKESIKYAYGDSTFLCYIQIVFAYVLHDRCTQPIIIYLCRSESIIGVRLHCMSTCLLFMIMCFFHVCWYRCSYRHNNRVKALFDQLSG